MHAGDKLIISTHFWESCWGSYSPSAIRARRAVRSLATSSSSWWDEWWTLCRAGWWLRRATVAFWPAHRTQSFLSHVWTLPHRAIFPCATRVCCWVKKESSRDKYEIIPPNGTVRRVVKISLNPCDNRLRSIKTTSCEARIVVSFEIEKKKRLSENQQQQRTDPIFENKRTRERVMWRLKFSVTN